MTIYTEADTLRDRLTETELRYRQEVKEWEMQERIFRMIRDNADENYAAIGWPVYLEDYRKAQAQLEALGPCPPEPLSIGLLKGRLHKLETRP